MKAKIFIGFINIVFFYVHIQKHFFCVNIYAYDFYHKYVQNVNYSKNYGRLFY